MDKYERSKGLCEFLSKSCRASESSTFICQGSLEVSAQKLFELLNSNQALFRDRILSGSFEESTEMVPNAAKLGKDASFGCLSAGGPAHGLF